MSEFDLRKLVKDVCDTSLLTNDDELAKEVLSRIDKADERAALEQALPHMVQRFVSRDHRPLAFPQPQAPTGDHYARDTQKGPVAGGLIPFRSRRISLKRSHWQRQLNARVNVAHKSRKFFGDCTVEDLVFLANHRRELAAANATTADYFEALTRLMGEFEVETVRELPESAVTELGAA